MSKGKINANKKVLLCECKRHTAHRVSSAPRCAGGGGTRSQVWGGVTQSQVRGGSQSQVWGGTPSQVQGGTPSQVLGGTPSRPGHGGGTPVQTWDAVKT